MSDIPYAIIVKEPSEIVAQVIPDSIWTSLRNPFIKPEVKQDDAFWRFCRVYQYANNKGEYVILFGEIYTIIRIHGKTAFDYLVVKPHSLERVHDPHKRTSNPSTIEVDYQRKIGRFIR
jgi:hypothetical protein